MTGKYITTILLFFLQHILVPAQDSAAGTFLQTDSKAALYYIDLQIPVAYVYQMGYYFDKAGTGYSIHGTDTLTLQPGNHYIGKGIKLINENNSYFLVTESRKTKKIAIHNASSPDLVNHHLNNAWWLQHYFTMSEELNKAYPESHQSFRGGFSSWNALPNKEAGYMQFRSFATERLKEMKDSIIRQQDKHTALTNYLIQHLGQLDYRTLKDSLTTLPATYAPVSAYYGKVVNAIAVQNPDYFFRLAEDFPQHQDIIFSAVGDNKDVLAGLKAAEGHDAIKKAFFKDRRFGKAMPYKIIGTYAVVIGLITLLIVSQK